MCVFFNLKYAVLTIICVQVHFVRMPKTGLLLISLFAYYSSDMVFTLCFTLTRSNTTREVNVVYFEKCLPLLL